ncbi:MAG: hypothetical protein V1754_03630, partial [Pseudomonadota bacterium]
TQKAQLATTQTGAHRRFLPEELLASGLDLPRYMLGKFFTAETKGNQAKVKLTSTDGKHEETLFLQRFKGRWRVVLKLPKL